MPEGALAQWLVSIGLPQYERLFIQNEIDLDVLSELTEGDLEKLGIPLGSRKRLLKAIASRGSAPSPPSSILTASSGASTPQAERRQLTVMFCDLVGSTALAQRLDPETLRELLRTYQSASGTVIEKFDGHVAQYLGDGLMVYFGWPRAHEDDVERAVRAGLEMITAVKQVAAPETLQVRIGIATGPVVVGETGAGDASVPKVAVGETPNVAARLQGLAGPDQVIVAPATHRLLGTVFEYEDLGDHVLKGIVDPVHAWRIVGLRETDGRFEAARGGSQLTPLVGREEETAILMRRWEQARAGEGQVVLLCGEAGIGKSRIARALRDQLETEPHSRLRYQCSPFHQQSALHPVIEHLERAAGFARDDGPEQKVNKLEALLRQTSENDSTGEVAPLFSALLSLPLGRYPTLEYSSQKHKERTLQALVEHIACLSRRQPILMIVEDVHWVDPTTQEALDLLLPRVSQLPMLLLMSYRPEFTPRWSGEPHVTVLTLNRLNRKLGAQLASRLTGGKQLPHEVLEQILAKTDGVPLFVEELTTMLLESGYLEEKGDRFELSAPLPSLAIPSTLHDSLMARLDRLGPIKELAQFGACIGREFSHELVAAVSPLSDDAIATALDQLVQAQLIFRQGIAPDATYVFKHALVRDAAYDSLLRSRRQAVHRQIAAALEASFQDIVEANPETIADHYTRAGEAEHATEYWLRAGVRARHRMAVEEGLRHLTRGLETLGECPNGRDRDRLEFQFQRNIVLLHFIRRGYQSQEATAPLLRASQLIDLANDDIEAYGIHMALVHSAFHRGNLDAMRPITLAAMEHARKHLGPIAQLNANLVSGMTQMWSGQWRRATEFSERASKCYDAELCRTLHRESGFDPRISIALIDAYCLWLLGSEERARAAAESLLHISTDESDAYGIAMAYNYAGADLHYWMRDFEASRRYAEVAVRVAVENEGFGHLEWMARFQLGASQAKMGDVSAGIATASRALANLIAGGASSFIARLTAELADLHSLNGHIDEALQVLANSPDRRLKGGRPTKFPEIFRIEGALLAAVGRDDEAEACLREAIAIAKVDESLSFELRAAVELGRFLAQRGRERDVAALVRPIMEAIPEGRDRPDMRDAEALLLRVR